MNDFNPRKVSARKDVERALRPAWLRPLALASVMGVYGLALAIVSTRKSDFSGGLDEGFDITIIQRGDQSVDARDAQEELDESVAAAPEIARTAPPEIVEAPQPPGPNSDDVRAMQEQDALLAFPQEKQNITQEQAPAPEPQPTIIPGESAAQTASIAQTAQDAVEQRRAGLVHGEPMEAANKARAAYAEKLAAEIARHKFYPRDARSVGVTGATRVAFTVSAIGKIERIAIVQSSGDARLDAAALKILDKARASPPPGGALRTSILLKFNLKN